MEYIASLSYGKDSIAMLEAITLLKKPLDRIVTAEVWATDTIQADLPPMVEFKDKADKIIKERYGIDVEHFYATKKVNFQTPLIVGGGTNAHTSVNSTKQDSIEPSKNIAYTDSQAKSERGAIQNSRSMRSNKLTYQDLFYKVYQKGKRGGQRQGFPISVGRGNYCTSLKTDIRLSDYKRELVHLDAEKCSNKKSQSHESEVVHYIGIASDEPERIERHSKKKDIEMPLVEIGWDEAYCRKWCEENDLLSPIYTTATRGVLVLPQSRGQSVKAIKTQLPRPVGIADEMGFRLTCIIPRRRSHGARFRQKV